MKNSLALIVRMPLGGWVLAAFALSVASALWLSATTRAVHSELWRLRPRVSAEAQSVLQRGEPAPQAFNSALNAGEARALRHELERAGQIGKAREYHLRDRLFMLCYGALLVLGGIWAWFRGKALAALPCGGFRSKLATVLQWVSWLAIPGAIVAVAADYTEYSACAKMIDGTITDELVATARSAAAWKWRGVGIAAVAGLVNGIVLCLMTPAVLEELPKIWEQIVRTHRFVLRARFSVLAGALFTVLLLTGPGEDIVRTIATGAFSGEASATSSPQPDFNRLGWFAAALLILATTCWSWARLVLAVRFASNEQRVPELPPERQRIEERLRRDLPIYYGAMPFVAAASAFAVAPLREGSASRIPTAEFFAGSLAPLLIFFILPFVLVIARADTRVSRKSPGPLSWTLIGYGLLAIAHAVVNWGNLKLLGWVPLVLLVTALIMFGLGRSLGVFILPAALLAGGLGYGRFVEALPSALVLVALGALASWGAAQVEGVDMLHIQKTFRRWDLLRLIFSNSARAEIVRELESDDDAYQEMLASEKESDSTGTDPKAKPQKLSDDSIHKLRDLLRFCAVLGVLQLAIFLAILIWSHPFPTALGSGAVLALGFAAWVAAGSALLFVTQATRFPILGAALVLAVVCSGAMDNHAIRLAGTPTSAFIAARETATTDGAPGPVGAAFDRWRAHSGAAPDRPCIVVAAEGGGIRAAFWPAIVLGTLQDQSLARKGARPDFASHVFAISGVSGGSVGASVFAALCADQRASGRLREKAATICGSDHLAPTLGALLYPDLAQRFLPVAFLPDRAAAFEHSWERAWLANTGTARFAGAFSKLWETDPATTDPAWVPALFLNTTMVENGKRAICSNLPVRTARGGQFIDAHDLHADLRTGGPGAGAWQDLPVSAAAHASARFPLVSPPGRLPSGARVVDGGYFENSGATTGIDILNAVTQRLDQTQGATKLIFIFMRYAGSAGLSDNLPEPPEGAGPPLPDEDGPLHAKTNLLNETGGILGTLLATRNARGSYSQDAVFRRYLARGTVVVLSFTFSGSEIPLSWSLSHRSCNDMLRQFPTTSGEGDDDITKSNTAVAEQLFTELGYPAR